LLFWTNMPFVLLAIAFLPHLFFLTAQALWKLARGRLRPFLQGKLDAASSWREIRARRCHRRSLARSAQNRPHFALGSGILRDARNHLNRPPEKSAAADAPE
jgi:hypothetical protein